METSALASVRWSQTCTQSKALCLWGCVDCWLALVVSPQPPRELSLSGLTQNIPHKVDIIPVPDKRPLNCPRKGVYIVIQETDLTAEKALHFPKLGCETDIWLDLCMLQSVHSNHEHLSDLTCPFPTPWLCSLISVKHRIDHEESPPFPRWIWRDVFCIGWSSSMPASVEYADLSLVRSIGRSISAVCVWHHALKQPGSCDSNNTVLHRIHDRAAKAKKSTYLCIFVQLCCTLMYRNMTRPPCWPFWRPRISTKSDMWGTEPQSSCLSW